MASERQLAALPQNAYTPLGPAESYVPMVPSAASPPEATLRSVGWGAFLCFVFTAASAYSGLKVGQVMEAAIPISVLAIGLARAYRRRSTVLENVIITGIGGVSGGVVAGAVFTLPALYILRLDPHPLQTIFICLAGGFLGVLFLIPLRRYFVRETHGQLPYPEATAITEVLVAGEKGGTPARLLLEATAIAGLYDFFVTTFDVWREFVDFQFVSVVHNISERTKAVFNFDALAFILGLGYVMGLRSSLILCAGGVFSNLVLVPLVWMVGRGSASVVYPGTQPIAAMAAPEIFKSYVRLIGVGAIATAGIFGILKSLRVVAGSFAIAVRAFHGGAKISYERTDRDVSVQSILVGILASAIGASFVFGRLESSPLVVGTGLCLALIFSFFFVSVAANATATTARNPVSGMTILTIIVSSVVLLRFGLSGTTGMFFVMAIAGMVCTALSVSGQAVTDLKAGYWIGSTPAVQEKVKFVGVVVSAVTVGLAIVMLNRAFQFGEAVPGDPRRLLPAPQAAIMKALVQGFMSRQPVAYIQFGAGAMITVVMEMLGVPALIFALGMYLPLGLNTPALVGGALAHFLGRRSDAAGGSAGALIKERGVIIASGLMAGGALGGVLGAGLRIVPGYSEALVKTPFYDDVPIAQVVSAVLFSGLCAYVWFRSHGGEKEGA